MSAVGARRAAGRVATTSVAALLLLGCGASAGTTPAPPGATASTISASSPPTPSVAATPSDTPTPTVGLTEVPAAPPGTTDVEIPEAGIVIPVPDGWRLVDGEGLADPAVRDELAATYPGARQLLAAADAMGDRATPEFLAVDPSAAGGPDGPTAPNIAVLVSQPSVSGPLLDLVAGFIGTGFKDAFGAAESARDRVSTPLGEAIRFRYQLPAVGDTAVEAFAWVIGAPAGTLLISVMGPADILADIDPDALIEAIRIIP